LNKAKEFQIRILKERLKEIKAERQALNLNLYGNSISSQEWLKRSIELAREENSIKRRIKAIIMEEVGDD
jgi:hypothetical protein